MKTILNYIWFFFILSSLIIVFLVLTGKLPFIFIYRLTILGILFYILKLHFVNNMTIAEINYLTIVFNLVMCFYYVLIGIVTWYGIFLLFRYIGSDFFVKMFPTQEVYISIARRLILLGASLGIISFINIGGNHISNVLRFTNKVPTPEVVFVCISTIWVFIDWAFIGMFILIIVICTMPDSVRIKVVQALNYLFKQNIDLNNTKISNNPENELPSGSIFEYFLVTVGLIGVPIINGLLIHSALALFILSYGIIIKIPLLEFLNKK